MKTIGKDLWLLSMATQRLKSMDNEDLLNCFSLATALRDKSQSSEICDAERLWAHKLFNDVDAEVKKRDLNVSALFVHMDPHGQFLHGREELKRLWKALNFEDMVDMADRIMIDCATEQQRAAIIELEEEIVLET